MLLLMVINNLSSSFLSLLLPQRNPAKNLENMSKQAPISESVSQVFLVANSSSSTQASPDHQPTINPEMFDSIDQDDANSETSTIRYEQEPFETFRIKVAEAVAKVFHCDTANVHTEHMKGGSSNRVVGMTICPTKLRHCFGWLQKLARTVMGKPASRTSDSYVLRMARGESDDLDQQIAILKMVASKLSLPTPQVVHYDLSADNALESPYMVQRRIHGRPISHILGDLNLEQKKCVVKRFIQMVSKLASVQAAPGQIAVENLTSSATGEVIINKISLHHDAHTVLGSPQKSVEHMLEVCQTLRDRQADDFIFYKEVWDGFKAIIKSLEAHGFLEGPCVLVHGDLREYNILAEVTSPSTVDITGIVDWDDACFAPKYMAFRSPFWLWMPERSDAGSWGDDEDEKNAALQPEAEDDRVLQRMFLDNISEEYRRFAFAPEAFLARRLYDILRTSICSDWHLEEAEAIVREWSDLHPEDNIRMSLSYIREEDEDIDDYLDRFEQFR
jgi:hypothetical protein